MSRIGFMNTEVDNITFDEAVERCCELAAGDTSGHYVVTPNVDHIVRLESDSKLGEIYRNADLILTDGMPLVWVSRVSGRPIVEKVSGADLFPALCSAAAARGLSMFFFGAGPGVAARAADRLTARFQGLRVVGTLSPDYGFEKDRKKVADAINAINSADPDILVVGLGCPKQEKFIYENRGALQTRLSLGLGASLDFEAGNVRRAPKFMRDHGLEWLYRLTQDPSRLARRYLLDDIRIVPLAFKYRRKGA